MDESKKQIKDMEHREAKNNQSGKKKETNKQTKMRVVYASSGKTSRGPKFASYGCQKEKRRSKKLEIYLKK